MIGEDAVHFLVVCGEFERNQRWMTCTELGGGGGGGYWRVAE